ncbi:MAG: YfcC family protein [Negativicutes bacterium]|nr:YfcC family protein [Negativicutes bacterium]
MASGTKPGKITEVKVPHVFVIIFSLIVLVAIATWVLPAGEYNRVAGADGKTVVEAGSYHFVPGNKAGLMDVLTAPIRGFVKGAEIAGFILIVGGVFGVFAATGAIDAGILRLVRVFSGREIWIIPVFMYLFAVGGAVFGMQEEVIPFVGIFVPLALAMGYDSIVGCSIPYVGATIGFSSAMLNPFTVGIAQGIAEVPLFSGLGYRTVLWFCFTTITVLYMMYYARRVKKNPQASPTYRWDEDRRRELKGGYSADYRISAGQVVGIVSLVLGIVVIIAGVIEFQWYINEIAGVFLAMAIITGVVCRMPANRLATSFAAGARDLVGAAIVVALARGIIVVATDGKIIDTMLYYMAAPLQSLPVYVSVNCMFVIQHVINFFVSSGTGQAALTIPIMAPLGDLLGITRQTTVLIYQFGNGFTDMIFPTSAVLVASLGMAKIDWWLWVKWMIPLQIIYFIGCIIGLSVAVAIGF